MQSFYSASRGGFFKLVFTLLLAAVISVFILSVGSLAMALILFTVEPYRSMSPEDTATLHTQWNYRFCFVCAFLALCTIFWRQACGVTQIQHVSASLLDAGLEEENQINKHSYPRPILARNEHRKPLTVDADCGKRRMAVSGSGTGVTMKREPETSIIIPNISANSSPLLRKGAIGTAEKSKKLSYDEKIDETRQTSHSPRFTRSTESKVKERYRDPQTQTR